ncbi:formylglycine-generating enzyme family protein [Actinomadura alba]|uniref:Uncharacterized protein n=1 Tax=Actinomadura alba TaxID=406431 RepID=A0ABR7M2U2_9ACTN|nr:hypothetical protein [Actinomadura alba]MBC6471371.1 hypothetical protein [Actinomadura alba]
MLKDAAVIEYDPAPATLESTARWMRIRDELAAAGLTPTEILRVFLRAAVLTYDMPGPSEEMLALVFAEVPGTAVAREVCEYLITLGEAPDPPGAWRWHLDRVGTVAMARLASDGHLDPRFDRLLVGSTAPMPVVRALLAALPLERREALVLSVLSRRVRSVLAPWDFAAIMLDWLLALRDLVDTPTLTAVRAGLISKARGSDRIEELITEEASGTPRPIHSRPTPTAQQALQYLSNKRAAERRAEELGPLAERAWRQRFITVEAPELVSVAAWAATSERRRLQIAEAIVAALGNDFSLVGMERFGGPPIVVLSRESVRFCVVPGGSVDVGFSPEEEAEIRHAAARRNDWEEDYSVLDELDLMRPLTRVEVGPMVVAQAPSSPVPPHAATDELERSPLRLPSEAEWEYLARGGRSHQLTYRGPDVPDSEEWFEAVKALGADGANTFGLYGFGFEAEACADVFHPGHDGLPADGSPRRGTGPRVTKGGAAYVYPWQGCGEWHLLLSAMRTPQTTWEYALSLRFVIGIQTGRT